MAPVKRRSSNRTQASLKLTKGIPGKVVEKGRVYAQQGRDFFGEYISGLYDTVMPEAVGWLTTTAHAFLGAFFFVLLMNYATAHYTPVCTVTSGGVASADCEYTATITDADDIRYGWFPNYSRNILPLAGAALTITTAIHGIFSALGQTHFTVQAVLGNFLSSFVNKGEETAYMRTAFVLIAVIAGNFLGTVATGPALGTTMRWSVPDKPYKVVGTGLGGPGLSYSGELLDSSRVVWGFLIMGTLSSLAKFIFYSETQARRSARNAEGLDISTEGGVSPKLGDRSYGFLSHFQHALAMGIVSGLLVLVFGPYHGTAGLDIGRDIMNLSWRSVGIKDAVVHDDPGLTGSWALYIGFGFLAWFIALVLHLAMGFIRKRDRLMLS